MYYYEGDLLNGKRHGFGKFYSNKNELLIEGQWKNDYPQGDITIYNPKGFQIPENEEYSYQNLNRKDWVKYNGNCEKGAKHGQGKLQYADDTYFIGMFKNDKVDHVLMAL